MFTWLIILMYIVFFSSHNNFISNFNFNFSSQVIKFWHQFSLTTSWLRLLQIPLTQFPNQSSTSWRSYMSMLSSINNTHASPVMVDHFHFRSRLKLISVFILFFANIFSFYLFIVLKIILVLLLVTVNRSQ